MINAVQFQGNMVKDPELRYTPSGTPVCNFSLAHTTRYKTADGEKKERTAFVEFQAWKHLAQSIAKQFTKGQPILIEGELNQEKWTDKATNQNRSRVYVIVGAWHFCGGESNHHSGPINTTYPEHEPRDE